MNRQATQQRTARNRTIRTAVAGNCPILTQAISTPSQELKMNREFNPPPKALRGVFVVAALFAAFVIVASVDQLSRHYGAEAQFAAAKSVAIAKSGR
jgi:hypothetical protein